MYIIFKLCTFEYWRNQFSIQIVNNIDMNIFQGPYCSRHIYFCLNLYIANGMHEFCSQQNSYVLQTESSAKLGCIKKFDKNIPREIQFRCTRYWKRIRTPYEKVQLICNTATHITFFKQFLFHAVYFLVKFVQCFVSF